MTRPPRASAGAWGLAFAIVILLSPPRPRAPTPVKREPRSTRQTTAVRTRSSARPARPLARAGRHRPASRPGVGSRRPGPAFHNPCPPGGDGRVAGRRRGRWTRHLRRPGWDSGSSSSWLNSTVHRQRAPVRWLTRCVGIGTARSPTASITAVEVFGRSSATPPPPRPSRQRVAGWAGPSVDGAAHNVARPRPPRRFRPRRPRPPAPRRPPWRRPRPAPPDDRRGADRAEVTEPMAERDRDARPPRLLRRPRSGRAATAKAVIGAASLPFCPLPRPRAVQALARSGTTPGGLA